MDESTKKNIETEINDNDVVLFMKGTPVFPQCGFSAATVGVLNHLGVKFNSVNVLDDQSIREGIKEFTNWPTIPQVYVKGEFIGGSDILISMYNSGELREKLEIIIIKKTNQSLKRLKKLMTMLRQMICLVKKKFFLGKIL